MRTTKFQPRPGFYPGRPSVGNSRTICHDDLFSQHNDHQKKLPSFLGFPRADCENGPRPCPLVGCPFNNYLEVDKKSGNIKITNGLREPEEVPPKDSCCLDIADEGPQTLERVGQILGLTRERIRQIEISALEKIRHSVGDELLLTWIEKLPSP